MLVRCYVYDCKHNENGQCKLDCVEMVDLVCASYEKVESEEKFEEILEKLRL